jgi:DNA-binding NarL/FixJ family response regulator
MNSVRLRVLIADDNVVFRRLIAQYLSKQAGVEVVGDAVDGDEVVHKARDLKPNIVLLDVSMPKQPASTAAGAIKKVSPDTKVYLCSAHSDETLQDFASVAQADGIVRKSSLKSDLLRVVDSELHNKQ